MQRYRCVLLFDNYCFYVFIVNVWIQNLYTNKVNYNLLGSEVIGQKIY